MRKSYDLITDKEKLRILKSYNEGHTMLEISNMINISSTGVFNVLTEYKVKPNKPNYNKKVLTNDILREIRQRMNNGETQRRIAEEYGVHESAISLALKRNNI